MNPQKSENMSEHEESDHTQPINLVSARTPVPAIAFSGSSTTPGSQPIAMRTHLDPPKSGLMLYFRNSSTPRAPSQVLGVVGTQVSSSPHYAAKSAQEFKNTTSWTVIRMPTSDIAQVQGNTAASSSSGTFTSGILSSGVGSRHMIPAAVHPVIAAGNSGSSMASIIRGSHQVAPPFSSHVPRGPAAVASISAAPKSAVATPILRAPHSSSTMGLASSSMMALHTPVRAKSPTTSGRTTTPPAVTSLSQAVDLQKSAGHSLASSGPRCVDTSVVRTGATHSSAITIAKPINSSQPIVQHLQQVGPIKTINNLSSATVASNSPVHQSNAFTSVNESVSSVSRSAGYSTSIMQLSSATAPLQQLRASHAPQTIHALTSNNSVSPHQTLTVISAKSLMAPNHSVTLATPSARAVTPITTISVSAGASVVSSTPLRPTCTNAVPSAVPVAKVYPQSALTTRSTSETPTQESKRVPQPVVTNSARVVATTCHQSAVIPEKQIESSSSLRFATLAKQVGNNNSYVASPGTYAYPDQYASNMSVHPYSASSGSSGFSTTQLKPVPFAQPASGNSSALSSVSVSNSVQSVSSVMVAVDSRHHMTVHSYNNNTGKSAELNTVPFSSSIASTVSTTVVSASYSPATCQGTGINHTSPRPSILRKRPSERATNELMEAHSSEGEDNNFDMKIKVKEEPDVKDDEKGKCVTFYRRPIMSLLGTYRQNWKARHNHFARYCDVKPKEEKKPTVNELANQKGINQQVNGWKVYHLTAQMDEVIGLEKMVYSRLSHLLNFIENDPPALRRSCLNSDDDKIINKLTDLIKGNLQRSKIVQEQVTESKQQAVRILDHKLNVIEMVNKYVSKRPLKKKEKP